MPVIIKRSSVVKSHVAESGYEDLKPHQIKELKFSIEHGLQHYESAILGLNGNRMCPSNERLPMPCIHAFGHVMAWEVGLGKTAGALRHMKLVKDFLRSKSDQWAEYPFLMIAEKSTKWQTASVEIPKWRPDLVEPGKVVVIEGDPDMREMLSAIVKAGGVELVIVTYSHFSPTTVGTFEFLSELEWLGVYADEATALKNWSSSRTKRFNGVKRGYSVLMSATPQSGWPNKWHPLLHAVEPGQLTDVEEPTCIPGGNCPLPQYLRSVYKNSCKGCNNFNVDNFCNVGCQTYHKGLGLKQEYDWGYWKSREEFTRDYCVTEGIGSRVRVKGSRNLDDLKLKMANRKIISRVTHRDVYGENGRKPPVVKIPTMLNSQQKEVYEMVKMGLRAALDDEGNKQVFRGSVSMLAALTHFRRITTMSPAAWMLARDSKPPSWARTKKAYEGYKESSKHNWLTEFMENNIVESANMMIVGSEWTAPLDELEPQLEELGIQRAHIKSKVSGTDFSIELPEGDELYYSRIDGSTPEKMRLAVQESFNSDSRLRVLLVTKAAYKGMNLRGAGTKDDTVYTTVLGVPWLPDELLQLFGRSNRLDQISQLSVVIPVALGTIDEKIHSVLYGKQSSSDYILDGGDEDEGLAKMMGLHDMGDMLNWI